MELKTIASIAGKAGLFRIVKPTRTGVIVETLDNKKIKTVAGANSRVSVLKEVSIYTNDAEESIALGKVFAIIKEKFGQELPVSAKSSEMELMDFLEEILPQYDAEKVYPSDVKKLVSWYHILGQYAPEVLENLEKEPESAETSTENVEEKSEE